jgi:hypothetical protein
MLRAPTFDLASRDAALEGCISACYGQGVVDADSIVSIGVAMIAWGLSVCERDTGDPEEVEELRDTALEAVIAAETISLLEKAA